MGGSSQQTSSSGTSEPWEPLQGPLKDTISTAGNLYQAGVGEQVYPGSTVVPFSQPSQAAILQGTQQAAQGSPLPGELNKYATSQIMGGGFNAPMAQSLEDLRGIASGTPGQNPFFEQALDYQSGKIQDMVNSTFSQAGRVGSGAHGGTMAKELAGMRFGALSDQYNRDVANKMSAASSRASIGGMGDQSAQAWGGLAPSIDALRYADIDRMSKIGATIEGKQGEIMNEAKAKFDQQNELPWTHLEKYLGILSPPAVAFPKTSGTSTTKTPFNPMSLMGIPMMAAGK
jgi:hypothetical protein